MKKGYRLSERLRKEVAEEVIQYFVIPHLKYDSRMLDAQLQTHKAHVLMLAEQNIITNEEASKIMVALKDLEEKGVEAFAIDPRKVDIFTHVESHVIQKLGEHIGGKMHIGRSRNDLISTQERIVTRQKINETIKYLIDLRRVLIKRAEENVDTIMCGYTHTQHAQPITLAHYLIAIADAVERDIQRLKDSYKRVNISPMGAVALSTTGFPIDRERVKKLLGFDALIENSLDAVSSRDFVFEFLAALSNIMSNLSRFAEDLVLWSTTEYGIVELGDEYASVSSIMPQKKNPIMLESIRATTGIAYGNLINLLTILKALPIGMNWDLVFVDYVLWDTVDRVLGMIKILTGVVSTLIIKKEVMAKRAGEGFSTITELADTIVRECDVSFRTAHRIVGVVVTKMIDEEKGVDDITSKMLDEVSQELIGKSLHLPNDVIRRALDPWENVRIRSVRGGPAPKEVRRSIKDRKTRVKQEEIDLKEKMQKLEEAATNLDGSIEKLFGRKG